MSDAEHGEPADEGIAAVAAAALVGRLDYPMFVVTATAGTARSGCLAGFVTQCSILPARFLICVSKRNHTVGVAERSRALGLHLLGREQMEVAHVFGELSGDHTDKFALVDWHAGATGVPVLDVCAAWLEGAVIERVELGDHVGHVLEPIAGGGGGAPGELWYSSVRELHAGHPAAG
ncbi:MAG TPA: flavin reductase family protein [Acidimicrobiales bacterium]|nr:flavin reductase family protein [Acidimicrobiales bacterium]